LRQTGAGPENRRLSAGFRLFYETAFNSDFRQRGQRSGGKVYQE